MTTPCRRKVSCSSLIAAACERASPLKMVNRVVEIRCAPSWTDSSGPAGAWTGISATGRDSALPCAAGSAARAMGASAAAGCAVGASVVWRHDLDVERVIASSDVVLDADVRKLDVAPVVTGQVVLAAHPLVSSAQPLKTQPVLGVSVSVGAWLPYAE